MKTKTSITLSERELNIIYAWLYSDFKPVEDVDIDIVIIKKLNNACKRLNAEWIIDEWKVKSSELDEFGDKISDEEKEMRKNRIKDITNLQGQFYCNNCKYRTSEKTYKTNCVICNQSLLRVGGN